MKPFLIAALSATLLVPAVACQNCSPSAAKTASKDSSATVRVPLDANLTTLSVPKMHCAGCAAGIQAMLSKQPGVRSVQVNPKTKMVTVTYVSAKQSPKALVAALTKAGWPAKQIYSVGGGKAASKTTAVPASATNEKTKA